MIPKKIHYCWFGGKPLNKLGKKCLKSWKKYFPDYEIIEWNEKNFDLNCCRYVQEAAKEKKWAFVSDYARYKILYEQGGVYFDTDVEVIKPLDDLLHNSAYMGLETTDKVNTGLGFGAERNHWFIGENMNYYEKWRSSDSVETCPIITTRLLESKGLIYNHLDVNHLNGVTVYPTEYFCAKNSHTGEVCITKKTYTIHQVHIYHT